MRIDTSGPRLAVQPPKQPAAEPPKESPATAGDMVEILGGGSGALVGSIAGCYAGALGGAAVGTVLGVGLGAAWGAMTSTGPTEFLTNSLFGLDVAARAGLVIGGATGLVGGATLGWRGAAKVGHLLGASPEPSRPSSRIFSGPVATAVVTGGLLSGVAGGFAGGMTIAAAHHLITGSQMGAGSLAVGLCGAAVLGATGLVGASQILKGTRWAGQQAQAGWEKLQPVIEKVNASPHRRVAYGAAGGALLMGSIGSTINMGLGVAVGSAIMGAGLGAAAGFISKPPYL